jgi:hypothetical protein
MADILWDFTRQISAAAQPGNTTSFYDLQTQAFYTAGNTIKGLSGELVSGEWEGIVREPEATLSDSGYSLLDIEHHFNDVLFGVAYHDGEVVLLVYEYRLDASSFAEDAVLQLQPDNAIVATRVALSPGAMARLKDSNYSMFSPGTIVDLDFKAGANGAEVPWQSLMIDSVRFDELREKVFVKAKNNVAIRLLNQTFDSQNSYTGELSTVVEAILENFGITKYTVQATSGVTVDVSFDQDDSVLEGLTELCEKYSRYVDTEWAKNNIVVGTASYLNTILPATTYSFVRGEDVILRESETSSHDVYTKVCVRRSGASPLSVYGVVPQAKWASLENMTFYKEVHDSMTQGDMEALRNRLVAALQGAGTVETYTTGLRPAMQINDRVEVSGGEKPTVKGRVIDIQQVYGNNGCFTQFTITSTVDTVERYYSRLGHMNRVAKVLNYISSPDKR